VKKTKTVNRREEIKREIESETERRSSEEIVKWETKREEI
jgi:hypothetical protein